MPKNYKQNPKCIYSKENSANKEYNYIKIFKFNKNQSNKKKEEKKYMFGFTSDENSYIITLENKGSIFFYDDVILQMRTKDKYMLSEINQNNIDYKQKMIYFLAALENNKEEKEKVDVLYKETIELFSKKNDVSFLIELFTQIYQNKDVCSFLLSNFKKICDTTNNLDIKPYLKKYENHFNKIISEANEIINNNYYNFIDFYGIILCYLNYIYLDKCSKIFKDLSDNNFEISCEILLSYKHTFKNEINLDNNFLFKFMKYIISSKSPKILLEELNKIKNLDNFINIIDQNKEDIYNKFISTKKKFIIKLDDNFRLNYSNKEKEENKNNIIIKEKESINNLKEIIKKIESIISFSSYKKIFLYISLMNFGKNY